jgi:hypothetical protein
MCRSLGGGPGVHIRLRGGMPPPFVAQLRLAWSIGA